MTIRWSPSPEEIRLADEQPCTGPRFGAFRPAKYETFPARLSDRADAGQVHMDHTMFCEIGESTATTELAGIELKGLQPRLRVHS